jgi:hypothetical protein
MSFAAVEQLKAQYTDKLVEVDPSVPELRRFKGLVGTVKTVNMNGRLLVQFDHPVDIGWYDIDPAYLRIVEGKPKKAAVAKPAEKVAEPASASAPKVPPVPKSEPSKVPASPAAKPAAADAGSKPLSKLEQARQQGAAGKASATPPVASTPASPAAAAPAPGGRPLSKLELARMQGAAGSAKPSVAAPPAATSAPPPAASQPAPAKAATPASSGKPLSKLELARQQGAVGSGGAAANASGSGDSPAASVAPTPPPSATPVSPAAAKPVPKTGPDGKPLSKLELARLQGPFKG